MSEVLDLLTELVRRPSVTPDDAGCQTLIADRLAACGFEIRRMRFGDTDNLWATHGAGGPLFCFAGHTDVVPPGPLEAWTSPPFEPEIREGRLFGRGAQDMKAGVAAMVVALERLAREGHPGMVALLLTSDEEGPGHEGTPRALDQLIADGVRIDAALVGEPTCSDRFGDKIKVGRRGSLTGRFFAEGKQGHTAYPHLAENAAHRLLRTMDRVLALDWGGPTEAFPATSLQVTQLRTSTETSNVIPGGARATVNLRFGTNWTAETIEERLRECLEPGVSLSAEPSAQPFLTQNASLIAAAASAVREVTGIEPALSTDGGTSDARCFAARGIPVLEFGTRNDTIHAVNESVEIASLEALAEVYRKLIRPTG